MRTNHTPHPLPSFPVYSACFLSDDKLVLGGGGGSSSSGVKNKLRLYKIPNDHTLELISELELAKGEDAPMSMASDMEDSRLVCGINGTEAQMKSGENPNCRLFSVAEDRFSLVNTAITLNAIKENEDDCQKVTAISPRRTLLAAAGYRDLSVLSYPSLVPAAKSFHADSDIFDVAFSPTLLAVATKHSILIFNIPSTDAPSSPPSQRETRSRKKKVKTSAAALRDLELIRTVERPALPGIDASASTFRAIRFHPSNPSVAFTVQNATVPNRSRGSRGGSGSKQGFICRWDTEAWQTPPKHVRKIGEKGITCFDVSPNGKYLAYGAADYSIGVLDATTLAPLLSVLRAHEFPPTVIRFNPSTTLLVSGSADNSIRAVTIPEKLSGTTWTGRSVFLLTLLILLLSILISYVYSNGYFN